MFLFTALGRCSGMSALRPPGPHTHSLAPAGPNGNSTAPCPGAPSSLWSPTHPRERERSSWTVEKGSKVSTASLWPCEKVCCLDLFVKQQDEMWSVSRETVYWECSVNVVHGPGWYMIWYVNIVISYFHNTLSEVIMGIVGSSRSLTNCVCYETNQIKLYSNWSLVACFTNNSNFYLLLFHFIIHFMSFFKKLYSWWLILF